MTDSGSGQIAPRGATATAQSKIAGVTLFAGLITAGSITALSHVAYTTTGSVSGTTTLTGAYIHGTSIAATPRPNTTVSLPHIAYAILNEQYGRGTTSGASMTVNALDIHVTAVNPFGLPVGAQVVLGHTAASVQHYP